MKYYLSKIDEWLRYLVLLIIHTFCTVFFFSFQIQIYSKSKSLNTFFANFLDFTEKCVPMILTSEYLVIFIKIREEGKCTGIN